MEEGEVEEEGEEDAEGGEEEGEDTEGGEEEVVWLRNNRSRSSIGLKA